MDMVVNLLAMNMKVRRSKTKLQTNQKARPRATGLNSKATFQLQNLGLKSFK